MDNPKSCDTCAWEALSGRGRGIAGERLLGGDVAKQGLSELLDAGVQRTS